jgi:hypothetical protein
MVSASWPKQMKMPFSIILGLKTLGLVLDRTDELTNMTEKEEGNGKRAANLSFTCGIEKTFKPALPFTQGLFKMFFC